ncbi:hypothetical protein LOK49_LG13G01215 [Camellia lanceoleosa]|uniref:Uncharacterized protein n=1 Tax=Camellia lanceoleosa TaxID=1840588 RepID=A0ACC0FNZ3_9ERIC|nr:hypothetical protein LOK49_LG13G01215 [Camellia lanceoleosa]
MLRLAHQVGSLVASSRNPPTVLRLASPPPQPSGFKSQPSHYASIGFTTTTATVIIINFFELPPDEYGEYAQ